MKWKALIGICILSLTAPAQQPEEMEAIMVEYVNQLRQDWGLQQVIVVKKLENPACSQASYVSQTGGLTHYQKGNKQQRTLGQRLSHYAVGNFQMAGEIMSEVGYHYCTKPWDVNKFVIIS